MTKQNKEKGGKLYAEKINIENSRLRGLGLNFALTIVLIGWRFQ